MPFSSDFSIWYTFIAQSGPLLLMQHLHPILIFKTLILFPPTLYLLPLHPHHRLMLLAVSLYLLLPLPLPNFLFPSLTSSGFFNGMLGGLQARSTKLLHFISSHPVDLIHIQESNLNSSSFFQIPGYLLCDPMAPTPNLVLFLLMLQTLAGASSFSSSRALSLSERSTSSLSSLDPYSDYVKVNISLNNFSSISFLNVYAPPTCFSPKDSRNNFFLSPFFPPMWKRKRWIFRASAFATTEKGPLSPLLASASTSLS